MLPIMKTAAQNFTSRTADKFVVRLPDGMREHIAVVARQHHRSMNSEIIARLEHSLLDLPTLPEQPSQQMLNDKQLDALSSPERDLLLRFREMSRRQQNALLALLPREEAAS
jgi:plasmid stability protein